MSSLSVDIRDLKFAWTRGETVLSVEHLSIRKGERLFLKGPSGSGKSTLLGVITGVFTATSGEATILGAPFHTMQASGRDSLRAEAMGVIFQQFNLAPYLTLVENVLLPCDFSKVRAARVGATKTERINKARALLERLGLDDEARSNRAAAELSVGQQQRVAAARALIGSPSLIIADEPTSALDEETRRAFIETLLSEAQNASVLFVSHDASLANHFDRQVMMGEINRSFQSTAQSPADPASRSEVA